MSNVMAKALMYAVLIVQVVGFCVILSTEFGSFASCAALCALVLAGAVEVILAIKSKRESDALTG